MKKIYVIAINFGYWFLFLLLLLILYVAASINNTAGPSENNLFFLIVSYIMIPSLVSFYGSYFLLFQLFVQKLGKWKWVLSFFTMPLLATLIALIGIRTKVGAPNVLFESGLLSFFLNSFHIIVGFVLRSFIRWFSDLKQKEELNQKTIALELELLKLKLDPHFLFNTINNIDVLIEIDAPKASEYIQKLSSILRFYLYKTSYSMIRLAEEIRYLEEYIDLQKIRTTNASFVKLAIEGDAEGKEIFPMVFIPFVENAFKHAQNKKTNSIDIMLSIGEREVHFRCRNKLNKQAIKEKGIGNELIENRLKLIYGNSYRLSVTVSEDAYLVEMTIPV